MSTDSLALASFHPFSSASVPSSRQDRKPSVELATISEAMANAQGLVCWVLHPKVVADAQKKFPHLKV